MNVNKVMLAGNFTRDPELKTVGAGTAVCDFTLAVNRRFKRADGNGYEEEVSFIACVAWRKHAEMIAQSCRKGQPLFVEGRLKQEEWEKDGKKQSKTKVYVEEFHYVGPRREPVAEPEAAKPAPVVADGGDPWL